MIEQELQRKIADFRQLGLPEHIPRDSEVHLVDRMVATIVGARRAGKSFRALQVAADLLAQRKVESLKHLCVVDFDNPILANASAADLVQIQSTFLKVSPGHSLRTPLVFILDEIHKVAGWEPYVIDLSANPNWTVIVTGSSSKLLRDDLATELRGKAISSTVFPLSFAEYLKFKSSAAETASTAGRAELARHFDEYLEWGSYPAAANLALPAREALLRQYFDTMILRDIIQRFNVSRPQQCVHLYHYLLAGIGKPHTLKSAYEYVRQAGFTTSRDSVREYIQWAVDSWLLFTVPIYSDSPKEQERNYKKLYAIDWALATRNSLSWDGGLSRSFENMLYLHMLRRYSQVRYYLTRTKRQEVDFIGIDGTGRPAAAVQVCMDLSDPETLQRELDPLVAAARYFGTQDNLIVTRSEERQFEVQGVHVTALPAWRWMLGA